MAATLHDAGTLESSAAYRTAVVCAEAIDEHKKTATAIREGII
jgi:hypothetical protein